MNLGNYNIEPYQLWGLKSTNFSPANGFNGSYKELVTLSKFNEKLVYLGTSYKMLDIENIGSIDVDYERTPNVNEPDNQADQLRLVDYLLAIKAMPTDADGEFPDLSQGQAVMCFFAELGLRINYRTITIELVRDKLMELGSNRFKITGEIMRGHIDEKGSRARPFKEINEEPYSPQHSPILSYDVQNYGGIVSRSTENHHPDDMPIIIRDSTLFYDHEKPNASGDWNELYSSYSHDRVELLPSSCDIYSTGQALNEYLKTSGDQRYSPIVQKIGDDITVRTMTGVSIDEVGSKDDPDYVGGLPSTVQNKLSSVAYYGYDKMKDNIGSVMKQGMSALAMTNSLTSMLMPPFSLPKAFIQYDYNQKVKSTTNPIITGDLTSRILAVHGLHSPVAEQPAIPPNAHGRTLARLCQNKKSAYYGIFFTFQSVANPNASVTYPVTDIYHSFELNPIYWSGYVQAPNPPRPETKDLISMDVEEVRTEVSNNRRLFVMVLCDATPDGSLYMRPTFLENIRFMSAYSYFEHEIPTLPKGLFQTDYLPDIGIMQGGVKGVSWSQTSLWATGSANYFTGISAVESAKANVASVDSYAQKASRASSAMVGAQAMATNATIRNANNQQKYLAQLGASQTNAYAGNSSALWNKNQGNLGIALGGMGGTPYFGYSDPMSATSGAGFVGSLIGNTFAGLGNGVSWLSNNIGGAYQGARSALNPVGASERANSVTQLNESYKQSQIANAQASSSYEMQKAQAQASLASAQAQHAMTLANLQLQKEQSRIARDQTKRDVDWQISSTMSHNVFVSDTSSLVAVRDMFAIIKTQYHEKDLQNIDNMFTEYGYMHYEEVDGVNLAEFYAGERLTLTTPDDDMPISRGFVYAQFSNCNVYEGDDKIVLSLPEKGEIKSRLLDGLRLWGNFPDFERYKMYGKDLKQGVNNNDYIYEPFVVLPPT